MPRFVLTLVALASLVTLSDLSAADQAPATPAATPAASTLAGTSFTIEIVSGEGETSEDVLTFDGTNLTSRSYSESRFAPGACTVKG